MKLLKTLSIKYQKIIARNKKGWLQSPSTTLNLIVLDSLKFKKLVIIEKQINKNV